MPPNGPKWGQEDFFPTNPDLADILGRTDVNSDYFIFVFIFSGPSKKIAQMAPNGARRIFSLLIQTLPTFWAERIWILRFFLWGGGPTFLDFQVPRFPKLGLGRIGLRPWAGWALGWALGLGLIY